MTATTRGDDAGAEAAAPAVEKPKPENGGEASEQPHERDVRGEAAESPPVADDTAEEPPEHAPGGLEIPDGVSIVGGDAHGAPRPVAIVVSRFNGHVTTRLLQRAVAELDDAGIGRGLVTVMPVPGAFELPLAAMALAKTRRFACVVALGCVIRGETPHFDFVAGEAASGLQLAALETGVPVAFGVLTVESTAQADVRIDRAADAVRSALEMADAFARLRSASAPVAG